MGFSLGSLSATSQLPRTANLVSDALNTDHLFEHWWYFRVAGDTRETALRDVGGTSRSGASNGTHLDIDFADLEARGLLKASYDADIYSTGPASGVLVSRLTLQNISANPQTVNVFAYLDADLAGTGGNDFAIGDNSRQIVTDSSGIRLEFRANGADFGQIALYPSLRSLLSDANVTTLTGVNTPINNGDYTGAFQWQDRALLPGESATFSTLIAIDTAANCPPVVRAYGYGSNNSIEIYTDTLMLQDNAGPRSIAIRLRNAPANALTGLLSNTTTAPGVPFLGTLVWVDLLAPAQFPLLNTNANGEAAYTFTIPPSPYLCGLVVHHQYFVEDLQSTSGMAQYTGALTTIVGKL